MNMHQLTQQYYSFNTIRQARKRIDKKLCSGACFAILK